MCLATVYRKPEDTVICQYVAKLEVEENTVIITDIMGERIVVEGKIKMVDLNKSIVEIICD